jgi:hypothetical protein
MEERLPDWLSLRIRIREVPGKLLVGFSGVLDV